MRRCVICARPLPRWALLCCSERCQKAAIRAEASSTVAPSAAGRAAAASAQGAPRDPRHVRQLGA